MKTMMTTTTMTTTTLSTQFPALNRISALFPAAAIGSSIGADSLPPITWWRPQRRIRLTSGSLSISGVCLFKLRWPIETQNPFADWPIRFKLDSSAYLRQQKGIKSPSFSNSRRRKQMVCRRAIPHLLEHPLEHPPAAYRPHHPPPPRRLPPPS